MTTLADDDDDVLERRHLCSDCIGEEYLSAEIQQHGGPATCSYCQETGKTIPLSELAGLLEAVFEQHYRRTSPDMSGFDYAMQKEGIRDWERSGDPVVEVIAWIVEIDEGPAIDLQAVLEERHGDIEMDQMGEETEFAADSHYARSGPNDVEYQMGWRAFEEGLKSRGRFFNRAAEARLEDLFGGVHDLKTEDGRPVVRIIGPGSDIPALHRARVFQSQTKLEEALAAPELLVGSPVSAAASAGRMNAKGVPVFYGATDAELTLAETRPPVGSRAILGRFDLLQPLRVLDVEALETVLEDGSLFDPGYIRRLERAKFLERLAARIRMPVMPDDEGVDYLATQAMAEYLADRVEPRIDGILYGSAQGFVGAYNVALLNHAARVRPFEPPDGASFRVWTSSSDEDGPYANYTVWEEIDAKAAEAIKAEKDRRLDPFQAALEMNRRDPRETPDVDDWRSPMLALDRESLEVRHIKAVTIDAPGHKVGYRLSLSLKDSPF
jgi:hypothetical protein